ncbi:hypothetical protein LAZ67_7001429 [Cordylochernes scorpioides]|uniref:CCHC-type domain-containing protein n=1 Tax=Cordylochernes scorpioides TaxID=51811 RepID=A0ABY6KN91_9ARAC|nr:hypothetical protein LAZ67_7001429 [Cordylochernes scorpioides]
MLLWPLILAKVQLFQRVQVTKQGSGTFFSISLDYARVGFPLMSKIFLIPIAQFSSGGRGGQRGRLGSGDNRGCYNCGEEGHRKFECTKPARGGGRGRGQSRDGGRNNTCYNCGEVGHGKYECTNNTAEDGGQEENQRKSKKACYTCGEFGHKKDDCPKSGTQESGDEEESSDNEEEDKSKKKEEDCYLTLQAHRTMPLESARSREMRRPPLRHQPGSQGDARMTRSKRPRRIALHQRPHLQEMEGCRGTTKTRIQRRASLQCQLCIQDMEGQKTNQRQLDGEYKVKVVDDHVINAYEREAVLILCYVDVHVVQAMKIMGIAEDFYQALIVKDPTTVDELVKFCRQLENMKQRRIKKTPLATMSDVDVGSICSLKCDELIREEEIEFTKLDQKIEAMIDSNLTEDQQNKLMNILKKFSDVFDFSGKSQPARSEIKHKIDSGDHAPKKQRPYRVSGMERKIIQQEVDIMMEQDIIQFSESPWSSPVVLVKKKNGSWRFCVDYRRLNKITKKYVYPLPQVDDALDNLSGARYYSRLKYPSGRLARWVSGCKNLTSP